MGPRKNHAQIHNTHLLTQEAMHLPRQARSIIVSVVVLFFLFIKSVNNIFMFYLLKSLF